jgi:lipopolysaccharide biosynthesis regulator YciM
MYERIFLPDVSPPPPRPATQPATTPRRIKELEHQVERLALLNQALWELTRARLKLTDEDLMNVAHDVDMRDGIEDERITNTPLRCPRCGRISSSKHWKCLYCGLEFEKPVMG